ncbi:MAG: outer membrane beta-barrel protein [Myxococcaceae bacterium]
MRKYLLLFCLCASVSNAQYFNNNAFQFQLSWTGFDTTAGSFAPAPPWPTTDQIQLGLGYQYALVGYSLWWVTQASISMGYARNYNLSSTQILMGASALTGLRYNFMTEAWRPYVMAGIGAFTLFNNPNSAAEIKPSSQAWMTLQLGPGIEWIFAEEMSFQLGAGGLAFFDFQKSPRFSYTANLSYLFYF